LKDLKVSKNSLVYLLKEAMDEFDKFDYILNRNPFSHCYFFVFNGELM
jgi:hypothetical protein